MHPCTAVLSIALYPDLHRVFVPGHTDWLFSLDPQGRGVKIWSNGWFSLPPEMASGCVLLLRFLGANRTPSLEAIQPQMTPAMSSSPALQGVHFHLTLCPKPACLMILSCFCCV